MLFFAALFCGYAVYRSFNAEAFRIAGAHTEIVYGSINTVLLLTSSLTMTVALRAATAQLRDLTLVCLAATAALGARVPYLQGPGISRRPQGTSVSRSAFSAVAAGDADVLGLLLDHDRRFTPCISPAGIAIVLVVFTLFKRRVIPVQGSTMEGVAIYWHFVDSVWLVLYPLLYLAGRS